MPQHHHRDIPWPQVVPFHRAIAARAEEGFFSLAGTNDEDERWTSVDGFEPDALAGPWRLRQGELRSEPFRLALAQGRHESLFLGGPTYLVWVKGEDGGWLRRWRPVLYREVEVRMDDDGCRLVPRQAHWNVNPLLLAELDRLQTQPPCGVDAFADHLVETATRLREAHATSLAASVLRACTSAIPELEAYLTKGDHPGSSARGPSPWVLFAPTSRYSALNHHLMRDYDSLVAILDGDATQIGGMRLLEDHEPPAVHDAREVLPMVPLSDNQARAVAAALGNRPLTVISGPPGCGKSQVVTSILLNCWANGQSVLFASNNNKAVDVVRDRLERFEADAPIAVRAGAKLKSNATDMLRRILNHATAAKRGPGGAGLTKLRAERARLASERKHIENLLESELPQRIDTTVRAAFVAYGKHSSHLADLATLRDSLLADLGPLGYAGVAPEDLQARHEATSQWLAGIGVCQARQREDEARRSDLQAEFTTTVDRRTDALTLLNMPAATTNGGRILEIGPTPDLLADWHAQVTNAFEKPLETLLARPSWDAAFDQWSDAASARSWKVSCQQLVSDVGAYIASNSARFDALHHLSLTVRAQAEGLSRTGLPESLPAGHGSDFDTWAQTWVESITHPASPWDWMPWSKRRSVDARLRTAELPLRRFLPLAVWNEVGVLDADGRRRLAQVVEQLTTWSATQARWFQAQPEIGKLEAASHALIKSANALGLYQSPGNQDPRAWAAFGDAARDQSALAERAAIAWQHRSEHAALSGRLQALASHWAALAGSSPVVDAWRRGSGRGFQAAVSALGTAPEPAAAAAMRVEVCHGNFESLIDAWRAAGREQEQVRRLEQALVLVPGPSHRVREWWSGRPSDSIDQLPADHVNWPTSAPLSCTTQALADVDGWLSAWQHFHAGAGADLLELAEEELSWARSKLQEAAAMLPSPNGLGRAHMLVVETVAACAPWRIAELAKAFRDFDPARLRAKISELDSRLQRSGFEEAKQAWAERFRTDQDAVQAVHELERVLTKQNGALQPAQSELFRRALRLAPIWITTAMAPQAIPLAPDLFDVVVIDEASQCTLTNLLPLMYRGRRLVVIGDAEQLRAIPVVRETEEEFLAKKFGVEAHLHVIGHTNNDVYKAATEALPGRRTDVQMLTDHFRSHPLVIGFSNQNIYRSTLVLKKPSTSESTLIPFGAGLHRVHVSGTAERGPRDKSWLNELEASKVIDLARDIRSSAPGLSLGVITPFTAQKDHLRARLDAIGLGSEVVVDTAYGFQGDERDIILFSPVVAAGMLPQSSNWLQRPHNLVNVALTRAREALFVVADFDVCRRQDGILRQLAKFCDDVQVLRDTSPAELELFSWMVVQGWAPRVHPRVGDHEIDFELRTQGGKKVAVEVDGQFPSADRGSPRHSKAANAPIDAFLEGHGYRVARFTAREVMETAPVVIERLREMLLE